MSIRITAQRMTSDLTDHWAVPTDAVQEYGTWVVSWLPGRQLTRNQAITAMVLAETVTVMQRTTGLEIRHGVTDVCSDPLWPLVDNWAAELGLTGPDAVVQVSEMLAATPIGH